MINFEFQLYLDFNRIHTRSITISLQLGPETTKYFKYEIM